MIGGSEISVSFHHTSIDGISFMMVCSTGRWNRYTPYDKSPKGIFGGLIMPSQITA